MEFTYTLLVNSRTTFKTNDYNEALREYQYHKSLYVIVVQLILNKTGETILEYRPSSRNGYIEHYRKPQSKKKIKRKVYNNETTMV